MGINMEKVSKRVAVITGASSGMGREFAKMIDKKFNCIDEIWLIARRKDRLEEVREEINKPSIIICHDVSEESFAEYYRKMLKQERAGIKLLINCAGYGIIGSVADTGYDVSVGMVKTNCEGLTTVTHLSLPYMLEKSRIINLASSAAFLPQPDFAIYAATKSYVLSFSRALNMELRDKQVFVTAVCPGPVATDFFRIAEDGQKRIWYKELFMVDCHSVVNQALEDSIARKELSIYGLAMKAFYILSKRIPHRFILKFMKLIEK